MPWGSDFAMKPDGTPYYFAFTIVWLGDEWCQSALGLGTSLLTRAGATVDTFDPNVDGQVQIGWLEDTFTLREPDALILHPIHEAAVNPITENYVDAGIPVFNFDLMLPSPKITAKVTHNFDDVGIGSDQAAEWLAQKAGALGEPVKVCFIWGMHSQDMCQRRNEGFIRSADQYPDLLTVVESPDSNWAPETMATLVQDAFTSDPSLNAVFIMGGLPSCVISGLKVVDRLYPVGDAKHVVVINYDMNPTTIHEMEEGNIDGCLSHQGIDLVQAIDNFLFYNVVMGKTVPGRTDIPLVPMTTENMDTLQCFGVDLNYSHFTWREWDI